jgi:hypothetical protein
MEVNDNTTITLPIRNLVALAFGLVVATTAWVTLNSRITSTEHSIQMQGAEIDLNSNFRITWPKEGLLAADVQQNSRLDSTESAMQDHSANLKAMQESMNDIKVTLAIIENRSSVSESKIETLYTLYNEKLTEAK